MPTLVNDLSHSQQIWLFETFGPSNDAEDHFPSHHSHREDPAALADSHFPESNERRVSDATSVQGEHHHHDPSQFSPHPHNPHPHQQQHLNHHHQPHEFFLPHAPDLQHHQPAPHNDNRNTIFRRGAGGVENEMATADLHPRPWSPTRSPDAPSPQLMQPQQYFQQQQQHQQHHHHHHPLGGPFGTTNDPRAGSSTSFAMLRSPHSTNSRPLLSTTGNNNNHTDDQKIVLQQKQQQHHQRISCSPLSDNHPMPYYPHKGEKLTWQQSFENLQVYKQSYGDCDVPQKYKHNVKLGGWVNKQRKKKKNPTKYGKLSDSQIQMMESIGFKWNVEHGC